MVKHTFDKAERLCSKKAIGILFEKGRTDVRSFYLFPFRVIYHYTTDADGQRVGPDTAAVLLNVSKRQFKHAVDRNLLRRRMREAYRLHKERLGHENKPPTEIAFLYIAKTKVAFQDIEKGMKKALAKIDTGHNDPPAPDRKKK